MQHYKQNIHQNINDTENKRKEEYSKQNKKGNMLMDNKSFIKIFQTV